jgi:two-component system sensor histidine kinase AgrC
MNTINIFEYIYGFADVLIPIILLLFFFHTKQKQTNNFLYLFIIFLVAAILSFFLQVSPNLYLSYRFITHHFGSKGFFFLQFFGNYFLTSSIVFLLAWWQKFSLRQIIFLALLFSTGFLFADSITTTLLDILLPNPYSFYLEHTLRIVSASLLKGVLVLGFRSFSLKQTVRSTVPDIRSLLVLGIISLISTVLMFWFLWNQSLGIMAVTTQLLIITGLVVFNICIILLYSSLERYFDQLAKAAVAKQSYQGELRYLETVRNNQEKISRLRHDLQNQYLVLAGLLKQPTERNIAKAQNYLASIIDTTNQEEQFFTHDFVLNFLLNEKRRVAETAGIQLQIDVFLPQNLVLSEDVLAIIIGNLLDNALQASMRNSDSSKKEISFKLKAFNKNLKLEISNTFDPSEKVTRIQRLKDGLGIRNIKQAVSESNGIYQQEILDRTYKTTIIFLNCYG